MYIYAIVEGERDNARDTLLTNKKQLSNKQFKKLYNEAVSHIKSKDKEITVDRIAKYLVKNYKFKYLEIELGVWGKTLGMRKIKGDDSFVKRGDTGYYFLD